VLLNFDKLVDNVDVVVQPPVVDNIGSHSRKPYFLTENELAYLFYSWPCSSPLLPSGAAVVLTVKPIVRIMPWRDWHVSVRTRLLHDLAIVTTDLMHFQSGGDFLQYVGVAEDLS